MGDEDMSLSLGDYIENLGYAKLELPNVGASHLVISKDAVGNRVTHVEYKQGKLFLETDSTNYDGSWVNTVVTQISPNEMHLRINKMVFEDLKKQGGAVKEMKCFSYEIKCTEEVIIIHGRMISGDDLKEYISNRFDCHKNPINKPIWDILEPVAPPNYDGDRLFITDDSRIYIAIVEGQWLEVDLLWLSKNKRSIPEYIFNEWQAYQGLSTLDEREATPPVPMPSAGVPSIGFPSLPDA
jgi:hypothetical protein